MIQILNKRYSRDSIIVEILQNIFGIGLSTAKIFCYKSGIHLKSRIKDVDESIFRIILNELKKKSDIEDDLKKKIYKNILKKKRISCYQGYRHIRGLPARGQRTHSNGQTKKRLSRLY